MTAIAFTDEMYSMWDRKGGTSNAHRELDRKIIDIFRHLDKPVSLGSRAGTRRQVRALLDDCGVADWDGYGAAPVTQNSIDNTIDVIRALPRHLTAPEIAPLPDGGIGLSWSGIKAHAFSIAVDDSDVVAFAGISGRDNHIHGTFIFDDKIPEEITRKIRALEN